jgi:hypothetical protein
MQSKLKAKQTQKSDRSQAKQQSAAERVEPTTEAIGAEKQCTNGVCGVSWKPSRTAA